jgi:ketosteroid isomerase-like protein
VREIREQNQELVRSAFEAFDASDVAGLIATLHPDVECHVAQPMMNAGTWHGIDGYLEMTSAWFEAWEGLRYEVVELEAPDDRHILAKLRQIATGAGSGVPVEMDVVFLFEVEEGLARRFHVYPDRESAAAAI